MNRTKNVFTNRNQSNHFSYTSTNNVGDWILVQKTGTISFRLGKKDVTVIGSEGCDINIQSPSVEKKHAVLFFDPKSTHFTVKDLQSSNGTYLNEQKLPPQTPAKLNNMDLLRFGYGRVHSNLYEIRSGNQINANINNDGLRSESVRLRRMSDTVGKATTTATSVNNHLELRDSDTAMLSDRFCSHVIQGVRASSLSGSRSRVTSPSFTLDSGHGSSSTPSSPAKEMSPLPNSVSSATTSPIPNHSKMFNKTNIEFGLSRSNSEQLLVRSELNSSQSLCASEDERIRKDSLEDVKDVKGNFEMKDSHTLHILESDLSVPNEIFQPQPTPIMSLRRNSPIPKSSIPERMPRSHSFSGDSSALSSLYGTPHWWPNERVVSNKNQNNNNAFYSKSKADFAFAKVGCEGKQGKCEDDECPVKEQKDKSDSDSIGSKKLSPMAFTVDFGEADTKKCLGIADSISRFAPRHRRNLSLTKAEEVMGNKDEEQKIVTATVSKFHRKTSLGTEQSSAGNGNKHSNANGIISCNGSAKYIKENINGQKSIKESLSASILSSNKKDYKINSSCKPSATIMPTSSNQKILQKDNSTSTVKDMCNNNLSVEKKSTRKDMTELESEIPMNTNVAEDAASEAGTYTIKKETVEVQKARKNIDSVFGTKSVKKFHESFQTEKDISGDPASLAWVREWAESAAQLQQTSPSDLVAESETRFFLQETENLVSAMQERVSQRMSNNNSAQNTDSEEEPALSYKHQQDRLLQKPHTRSGNAKNMLMKRSSPLFREASVLSDSGYALGYASDSSNEGSRDAKSTAVKYNRALALRRGRVVGYDSDGCTTKNRQTMTLPVRGVSPRPQAGHLPSGCRPPLPSPSPPLLSRNDGGRFSLRVSHTSKTAPNVMIPLTSVKSRVDSGISAGDSSYLRTMPTASTYKPDLNIKKQTPPPVGIMRKLASSGESRCNSTLTSKEVEFANWKRRKSYNPMRAAAQGKKKDSLNNSQKNEDDSANEQVIQRGSSQPPTSMKKSASFLADRYVSGNSEDEDLSYIVDELESSHSNSPSQLMMSRSLHEDNIYCALTHQNNRSKNKLEALDNLVIATIHSLSVKVRTSSRHLLEKLQVQHCNDENGALLEEMVSQLKDLEMGSTNSSPTKSASRELSGTLKNLKKLEQVILVLDRVLCDDDVDSETN